jgi:nucleotide-binding universal stress UspA family protein
MERALTDWPMETSKHRLERVLCAVTFSPSARRVVAWAAALAGSNDAEVRLFHALANSEELASAMSEADSERVLTQLFALAQQLPGRPRISAAVTAGEAASEILRHARLINADLIAIGMHAEDGRVSRLVTRLALDAPCPVLVVDEGSMAPPRSGVLNQVLVAVNFLPASLAAADYAFALARLVGAQVTIVHVLPEHWEGPQRHDQNVEEARQFLEHHFRRLLQNAVSTASGVNRDHNEVVASGRPCVEIVRLATLREADLIVMGIDAPPKSAPAFGETTSCVMQFAGRTILLVPERLCRARGVRRDNRPS